jgi:hypothetical protein
MGKNKIIFKEKGNIFSIYHHPDSMDSVEYAYTISVKDGGKLPVTIKLKSIDLYTPFAPEMPDKYTINATDLITLFIKLEKWFSKYGYIMKPD